MRRMCSAPSLPRDGPSPNPVPTPRAAAVIPRCPWAYLSHRLRRFSIVGGPVLGKSVSHLLGRLLHEELATRWEQLLLDEAFTGGALAWLPGRTSQVGQLVYPAGGALDRLCILLVRRGY